MTPSASIPGNPRGGLSPLPARCEASSRAGGFTLMELLVVLAIIGLLLAAAPALIGAARPGIDARSAAIAIADALRAARSLAVATGRETRLTFDIADGRYGIEPGGPERDLPQGMVVHFRGSRGEVTASSAGVRFFPDGTSTGAELLLAYRGHEHRILAHWLTGRVSVDD
jgi:general secretion pathway protein H